MAKAFAEVLDGVTGHTRRRFIPEEYSWRVL